MAEIPCTWKLKVLDILKFSDFSLGPSDSSNMGQVSKKDQKLRDDNGMQTLS